MSNHAQQKERTEEISHFWTTTNARNQLEYRLPMLVTELMVFSSAFGRTSYYVCPRCNITMEREFQSYCDRCGQRLDWKRYRHAKIIWPKSYRELNHGNAEERTIDYRLHKNNNG